MNINKTTTKQTKHHRTGNLKDEQHGPHKKPKDKPRCSRKVNNSCFLFYSYSCPVKVLPMIKKRQNLRKMERKTSIS
jgi:hypothetical protein